MAPHSAKFLFIPDITNKATGAVLVVLILLYVGSQVGSTLIATATADPTQRRLMLLLPLMFVVILYRYPAGLLVYWITTNLWTIGQQYLIRRRYLQPPRIDPIEGRRQRQTQRSLRDVIAGAPRARRRRGRRGGRRRGRVDRATAPRRRAPAQEEETLG